MSAQFQNEDFSARAGYISLEGPNDGTSDAIGGYFRLLYPQNWPISERYKFDWRVLANNPDPFQQYPYPP
jgi:hypothetical protein